VKLLSGQRAFIVQRLSALVLLAYLAAAALRLAVGSRPTFAEWQAWSAQPLAAAALLVVAFALFAHAWVGIRDVILDYAPAAWRALFLAAAALGLVLLAARTAFVLVSHAL
jgi:succinate dehydrogenase / fumarate reductase membrane anchor subunit